MRITAIFMFLAAVGAPPAGAAAERAPETGALRRAYFRAESPAARRQASPYVTHEFPGGVVHAAGPKAAIEALAGTPGLTLLGFDSVYRPAPILLEEIPGLPALSSGEPDSVRSCYLPDWLSPVSWGIKALYDDPNLTLPSGGAGVKVAVIDAGVAPHPDLVRRIAKCVDMTPIPDVPPCTDVLRHGTMVASVIAADGGADGRGMYGMAPEATIYSYRVCQPDEDCWGAFVAAAIYQAIEDGVNIINLSLVGTGDDPVVRAAINAALAHNILFVAAAGNSPPYSYVGWPAIYPEVLSVGAVKEGRAPWEYSAPGINDGDYVREDKEIEMAAPGSAVLAAFSAGCWVLGHGTSLASPHIAGLAAKLWNGDAVATRKRLQRAAKFGDVYVAGDDTLTGFGVPTVREYGGTLAIVASATPGGTVNPSGVVPLDPGSSQTFTMAPSSDCATLADVKVDGGSRGPLTSFTFLDVRTDHILQARFATLGPFTITATAGPGGAISPAGATTVACGGSQTYTITAPTPGCGAIVDVKVDGISQGPITSYTFTNLRRNHTIQATITSGGPYTIAASSIPPGWISPSGSGLVTCNSSRTYTITAPPPGCGQIVDVKVDGVSQGPITSYTFDNVTANHTIQATIAGASSYTINASSVPAGWISPSGPVAVACRGNRGFAILAPPPGCGSIVDVKVDGVSQGPITSYTFSEVTAHHTIEATISRLGPYTITASSVPAGVISPSGATVVVCGTNRTYTITPPPPGCGELVDVKVDGVSQGPITSYTFSNVTANHTIDVTATGASTHSITASSVPTGWINPSGTAVVPCRSSKGYTILAPPPGCGTVDVKVDGVSQGPITSYTFANVTASHTIEATVSLLGPFTITASSVPAGVISPIGAAVVACGSNRTYTIAAPPPGCGSIVDVKVDGVSRGRITSYTFTNVNANHTIEATVSLLGPFTITASSVPAGSISPSGTAVMPCGSSGTYTIIPPATACGEIQDVKVDGVSQGPITSYTFANVTANHTIEATISGLGPYTITATSVPPGLISPGGSTIVPCGANQGYLIASPPTCGSIQNVIVDGVSLGPRTSFTFTDVRANHTIHATGSGGPSFTINASAGSGGSISPEGTTTVLCRNDKTYTITPDNCYTILRVYVDGVNRGAVSSYTFDDVASNHTIVAYFTWMGSFAINASAGTGGTIVPSGATGVACGGSQTYTVTPADNCRGIRDLKVDGISRGPLSSYTFSNVKASHSISASFTAIGPFTIQASAGPGGTISPAGATSVACSGGRSYTITPADACHRIADVKVDEVSQGPIASYAFTTLTADHTIEATFAPLAYTIQAGAGAGGTITPAGATSAPCGQSRTYLIAPVDDCHVIQDVKVDGVSRGVITEYTFAGVAADHVIQATFVGLGPYTIQASAGPGSVIRPDGATRVACGASQSYTIASADACRVLTDVLVDGVSVGVATGYVFGNVRGDHTIAAISAPSSLVLAETHNGASWSGLSDGAIDLTVAGGVPPYIYAWSHGAASEDVERLAAGTYEVVVTDAQGCTNRLSVAIANVGPAELALSRPSPNPARGAVRLRYGLPEPSTVRLSVVDVQGREVAVLARGTQPSGWSWADWNGRTANGPAPAGVYFIRLEAAGRQLVERFALVR